MPRIPKTCVAARREFARQFFTTNPYAPVRALQDALRQQDCDAGCPLHRAECTRHPYSGGIMNFTAAYAIRAEVRAAGTPA